MRVQSWAKIAKHRRKIVLKVSKFSAVLSRRICLPLKQRREISLFAFVIHFSVDSDEYCC